MVLEVCIYLCSTVPVLNQETRCTASHHLRSNQEVTQVTCYDDKTFSEPDRLQTALPPSKALQPQLPETDSPKDWRENLHVEM